MKDLWKLIVSVIVCEVVGILGSVFTLQSIPTWYAGLHKPSFAPPNWIFGPVWTTLYILMGVSFYLIWQKGWKNKKVTTARNYFFVQLALNFLWSPLFFGLRAPSLGLIVIIALWVAIGLTIKKFYPLSPRAAYLLLPYFLWVSFATVLNAAIAIMN